MSAFSTRLRALLRCQSGATMVEFALLAPVFFMLMFGTIEASRMLWLKQTLEEVSYSTARCMSVSTSCETSGQQGTFAVNRASGFGVGLTSANVVGQSNVTCRGFPNSSRVTITHSFDSVLDGFVSAFPSELSAESCFPALT